MRLLWRRKPGRDEEIERSKEQVERTARIIAEQRDQVNKVVQGLQSELEVNHLAERVRWALRDHPR